LVKRYCGRNAQVKKKREGRTSKQLWYELKYKVLMEAKMWKIRMETDEYLLLWGELEKHCKKKIICSYQFNI